MMAMTGRPKGLHYTSVLLVLGFLAHVSAQQQQRADVKPPATVTAQAYPAEQVQAGQTAFACARKAARGQALLNLCEIGLPSDLPPAPPPQPPAQESTNA